MRWWRRTVDDAPYDWTPAYELLLEEARRTVDRQMLSVREARQRAGSLVGYASVTAAALGFTAADRSLGFFGWVAVAGFLLVGAAAMAVLYPRTFRQDLRAVKIDAMFDDPDNSGTEHMLRTLALAHDENYAANLSTVTWLHRGISAAVAGLVIESTALVLRLVL
jgi:hypothetical protein